MKSVIEIEIEIEISKINNLQSLKDYDGIDPKKYYLLNDKLINLNLPF